MAIKLSEIQIEKLKARKNKDIVVWRPPFSRNVHIGARGIDWTFCGRCPTFGIAAKPWTWTDDPFCERCVKVALTGKNNV